MSSQTRFDDATIARFVHAFYHRVRLDALLGPVFDAEIHDWDTHLARMVDFWSTVLEHTGRFDGNPMEVHARLPHAEPHHFARWIALFEEVLLAELGPERAEAVMLRAHRMRHALEAGRARHHAREATPREVSPREVPPREVPR